MNKIELTIDRQTIQVPEGSTIMEAAAQLKILIPALCHMPDLPNFTSCMLCVVHEIYSDRLLPACSAPVHPGMRIETSNDKVIAARCAVLEMLLLEHSGNCRAPCQRSCPAQMNIPLMIRQIKTGDHKEALVTVKKDIALPAVLGRICPAPCEKGCLRGVFDSPVAICRLKGSVAEADLAQTKPYLPAKQKYSGKKIAVVGAGPTGLSAAYYLLQLGHDCSLFDDHPFPGGMLRYGVAKTLLPEALLDQEIAVISALGAVFHPDRILGKNLNWRKLAQEYDALVLALGKIDPAMWQDSDLELTNRGIKVDPTTFATSIPGIFAGGNAVSATKMAVRSVSHGKSIALAIDSMLRTGEVQERLRRLDSRAGKLTAEDISGYIRDAAPYDRITTTQGLTLSAAEARKEAARCCSCDCSKADSCRLRSFADEYQAKQKQSIDPGPRSADRILQHDRIVYEPGKCIRCGLCVRITEKAGEKLGLAFAARGAEVRVAVPFNETLDQGVVKTEQECVKACPTAALFWRDRNKE